MLQLNRAHHFKNIIKLCLNWLTKFCYCVKPCGFVLGTLQSAKLGKELCGAFDVRPHITLLVYSMKNATTKAIALFVQRV